MADSTIPKCCCGFSRKQCAVVFTITLVVQVPILYYLYQSQRYFDHSGYRDIFTKSAEREGSYRSYFTPREREGSYQDVTPREQEGSYRDVTPREQEGSHRDVTPREQEGSHRDFPPITVRLVNVNNTNYNITNNKTQHHQDHNQATPTTLSTPQTSEKCPNPPPKLVGLLAINFDHEAPSFDKIFSRNPGLLEGGHFVPDCTPSWRVAIIIPFRNRDEHLQYFLEYMHPILSRQLIEYQIFIINQAKPEKFNRAMLLNVGFKEALNVNQHFDCFAFHDVDLIIENDFNLYYCSEKPRHLSGYVDKFHYSLPYTSIFGGATLFRRQDFELVNGHSNKYWGWGGEDDDMYNRVRSKGLSTVRYGKDIAKYKMITHKREKGNEANPKRFKMITQTKLGMISDGLNSLKYKVIKIEHQHTYTNITVELDEPS